MGEAAQRIDDQIDYEERLDERIVPRTSVHVAIDIYSEHDFWSGLTMNISEDGVFVATQKILKPGTTLIVDMALPGEDEPSSRSPKCDGRATTPAIPTHLQVSD